MLTILADTWRSRELLWALTEREIHTRYRRSFLGLLWSLITPLYQVLLMTLVVRFIWGKDDPNYSIKFLCGLVPWAFFSSALTTSCASILRARELVKRAKLPRQAVPWAVVGSCFFHYVMSVAILLVILLLIPVAFSKEFLFLPVLMLIELVMVAGLALLAAVLHTFYQDVEYIITNLISAFYFATPVMWHKEWIPWEHARDWVMFNPMGTFCQGFRDIILGQEIPDPIYLLTTTVSALLCLFVGVWFFKRREWQLPEVI